jgi:cytidylate kinase
MAVITVSREYHSRGTQIARQVAHDLGYNYFDKNILTEVARVANTTAKQISCYDERCENGLKGFLKKLFVPEFSRYLDFPYYYYPSEFLMDSYPVERDAAFEDDLIPTETEVLGFFQHIIEKLWKMDNVVIVGRGSQIILADTPNTLHARCVAPLADRIERVMEDQGIVYPLAEREIEAVDKQHAQYIRHCYDADWADTKHYDLVLNTGSMSDEQAAKVIITAIHNQEAEAQSGKGVETWKETNPSALPSFISHTPPSILRDHPRHWG